MMAEEVITFEDLEQLSSKKMLVVTPILQFEWTGVNASRTDSIIKVEHGVSEEMEVATLEELSIESNNIKNAADTMDYAIKSEYETGLYTDNEPYHIWTTIKPESLVEEQVRNDTQFSDCDYDSNVILHSIIKTEPETIQYESQGFLTAIRNEGLQINHVTEQTFDLSPTKRPALRRTCKANFINRIQNDVMISKCDVCETPFIEENTRDSHVCGFLKSAPYKCNVCDHRFREKITLERHLRTHIGAGQFQCDVCLKRFKWRSNLITHIKKHSGLKPYKCNVCKKSFNCTSNLSKHQRIHTNKKVFKAYKCDVCNILIGRKDNFRTHMRIHTNEKRFKCDICHEAFLRRDTLDRHTLSHANANNGVGIRRYKCNTCEKSFFTKNDLTKHSIQHTGTKPFKCNVCDKRFTRKDSLYAHLRVHTGVTPYQCYKCDKYFVTKSVLTTHIRDVDHTINVM